MMVHSADTYTTHATYESWQKRCLSDHKPLTFLHYVMHATLPEFSLDESNEFTTAILDSPRYYLWLRDYMLTQVPDRPPLDFSRFRRALARVLDLRKSSLNPVLRDMLFNKVRWLGRRRWGFQVLLRSAMDKHGIPRGQAWKVGMKRKPSQVQAAESISVRQLLDTPQFATSSGSNSNNDDKVCPNPKVAKLGTKSPSEEKEMGDKSAEDKGMHPSTRTKIKDIEDSKVQEHIRLGYIRKLRKKSKGSSRNSNVSTGMPNAQARDSVPSYVPVHMQRMHPNTLGEGMQVRGYHQPPSSVQNMHPHSHPHPQYHLNSPNVAPSPSLAAHHPVGVPVPMHQQQQQQYPPQMAYPYHNHSGMMQGVPSGVAPGMPQQGQAFPMGSGNPQQHSSMGRPQRMGQQGGDAAGQQRSNQGEGSSQQGHGHARQIQTQMPMSVQNGVQLASQGMCIPGQSFNNWQVAPPSQGMPSCTPAGGQVPVQSAFHHMPPGAYPQQAMMMHQMQPGVQSTMGMSMPNMSMAYVQTPQSMQYIPSPTPQQPPQQQQQQPQATQGQRSQAQNHPPTQPKKSSSFPTHQQYTQLQPNGPYVPIQGSQFVQATASNPTQEYVYNMQQQPRPMQAQQFGMTSHQPAFPTGASRSDPADTNAPATEVAASALMSMVMTINHTSDEEENAEGSEVQESKREPEQKQE